MRNLDEVLREKETALLRVRQEVEALQLVAPMLSERGDQSAVDLAQEESSRNRWPLQVAPGQQMLG